MLDHIDVLKEAADIFAKGVVDAGDTMVDGTAKENGVLFSDRNIEPNEIISRINENIENLSKMDSVKALTGKEFSKGKVDLVTQVSRYFDSINNTVYNRQIGDINRQG